MRCAQIYTAGWRVEAEAEQTNGDIEIEYTPKECVSTQTHCHSVRKINSTHANDGKKDANINQKQKLIFFFAEFSSSNKNNQTQPTNQANWSTVYCTQTFAHSLTERVSM